MSGRVQLLAQNRFFGSDRPERPLKLLQISGRFTRKNQGYVVKCTQNISDRVPGVFDNENRNMTELIRSFVSYTHRLN